MQVAKYWRNNNLRYRLEGVVQNKVERKEQIEPVKLTTSQPNVKNQIVTKAEVA